MEVEGTGAEVCWRIFAEVPFHVDSWKEGGRTFAQSLDFIADVAD